MKPISAATPSRTPLEAAPLALEEPAAVRGRGKPSGASGSRARWSRAACARERVAGRACPAWSTVAVIRADVRPGRPAIAAGGCAWRAERRGVPNGDAGDATAGSPSSTVKIGIPATAGVGSTTGGITTKISISAGSSRAGGSSRAAVPTPGSANVMTGRNDRPVCSPARRSLRRQRWPVRSRTEAKPRSPAAERVQPASCARPGPGPVPRPVQRRPGAGRGRDRPRLATEVERPGPAPGLAGRSGARRTGLCLWTSSRGSRPWSSRSYSGPADAADPGFGCAFAWLPLVSAQPHSQAHSHDHSRDAGSPDSVDVEVAFPPQSTFRTQSQFQASGLLLSLD